IENNKKNFRSYYRLMALTLIIIIPLFSTDLVRGQKFYSLLTYSNIWEKSKVPKEKKTLVYKIGSVLFSNELFFSNFSMYASLKKEVPVETGISLKYLASSMIPTAIKANRPDDVYSHYAKSVGASSETGQGYTIHHA